MLFQHTIPVSERTVGVLHREDEKVCQGFTLFSSNLQTYLIDNDGKVINEWASKSRSTFAAYLLPNGNLLRDGNEGFNAPLMQTGGSAGYIEEVTWDNKLVWKFQFAPFEKHLSHHALEPLPNGNVLALCWERKTKEDALKAGRHPEFLPDNEIWNDLVVELEPDREKKKR